MNNDDSNVDIIILQLYLSVCSVLCSTGENIAVFVWEQLEKELGPQAARLHEISLEETENNTFVYRGEKT